MLELALVLPVLVVLLLAALDFARMFNRSMAVTDAARAGAQWGAQNGASAVNLLGMEQAACNSMADLPCTPGTNTTASSFCQCAGSSGAISCTSPGGCSNVQNFVKVTATSTFQTVIAYPGLPSSVPLTASVTMQVQ
ncbi:MAG TPA: TadE/TadG family type IV pilus assembly protein [Candidatus Binataceae bacterium]